MKGRMDTVQTVSPRTARRIEAAELDQWMRRLADVPDIRMSKVNRIRRAIHLNDYDETTMLERVLPALESDLAAMCPDGIDD